jgi:excisionase family DNA binding protein
MKQAVKETSSGRLTYTVPEVARLLGINVITAYEIARQEGFPSIRIGRRIVPKEAFHRWLEQAALDKQSYDIAGN